MKIIIALDHHLEYITLRNNFSRIGDVGTVTLLLEKAVGKSKKLEKFKLAFATTFYPLERLVFLLAYLCDKSFIMTIVIFC